MSNKLKVSKNRKKSWKKHSEVNDVEEYLENNRFNQRIGGSVADKSDETLFVIEKTGNNDVLDESNGKTDKRQSKLKDIKSDIKYFKLLESQSKVDPIVSRNAPKRQKRHFLNDDQKFAKVWPQKRLQYLRAKEESERKKSVKSDPKLRFDLYDIWDEKQESDPKDKEMEELIDYQLILKGSKPPKVPKQRFQKPSLLPAIEVPHSGQSYNPVREDHQNLLAMAHNIEIQKIRQEKHLQRVVGDHYVSKTDAPNDHTWAQEMAHGLGLSDNEDDPQNEDNCEDMNVMASTQVVRPDNKKTKAKRRKELIEKQLKSKKKLEKSLKSKANDIFRLKTFKKELKQKEKESEERQVRRSQRNLEKQYKPKRMGRLRYTAPDIELNLTSELTSSLRRLKSEGNLLEDRFKSIQRRNLVEVRERQIFKRKYKLKKIPKKSSKESIV